jgi:hypothetical protein
MDSFLTHGTATEFPLERRRAGPSEEIDAGVVMAESEGVGPALDFMTRSGVQRQTALRVLAAPDLHRKPAKS